MAHANTHGNVQPGEYGKPFLHHDLDDQILEPLHFAELNICKTVFKHGVLNNASDDAREAISKQLAEWNHPLDTRRKENNRKYNAKWFTGERWASFCAGVRGSPGGPKAISALVMIIAKDLQQRGVVSGDSTADQHEAATEAASAGPSAGGRGGGNGGRTGRGRGRSAFNQRLTISQETVPLQAQRAAVQHVPTSIEQAADPDDLNIIRELFGTRAQSLINVLLAFDAYFAWYYPLKESIPFMCDMQRREQRALDNCRTAIDLHEIVERLTARGKLGHQSFLFHGAIFKVSRDILTVADIWSVGTSPLELQNAETQRVASSSGSRRMTMSGKYSTTLAISTLRNLLATRYLRRGDGVTSVPDSRRKERVFGADSIGRLALPASTKIEVLEPEYNPKRDTCIKAFVRLIAACANDN
mmetsp:Transcript_7677/g.15984  ORF Transcript_7677/g.15984 Transcript_7677/m.15984 type:complete len:415 (-) Transcript_7677:70-1314(-)